MRHSSRPRPDFPLNDPEARGAEILIAGRDFGIRAVISDCLPICRKSRLGKGFGPAGPRRVQATRNVFLPELEALYDHIEFLKP